MLISKEKQYLWNKSRDTWKISRYKQLRMKQAKADEMKKTGLDKISLLLMRFENHCKMFMNTYGVKMSQHIRRATRWLTRTALYQQRRLIFLEWLPAEAGC
jgi:hypothetical protein